MPCQDALPDLSDAGSEEIQEAIRCGLVGSGTQQLFGGKFFFDNEIGVWKGLKTSIFLILDGTFKYKHFFFSDSFFQKKWYESCSQYQTGFFLTLHKKAFPAPLQLLMNIPPIFLPFMLARGIKEHQSEQAKQDLAKKARP